MPSPNEHDIAILAYEYWVQRGCPLGSPEVDWYRAVEALSAQDLPLSAFHLGPDTSAPFSERERKLSHAFELAREELQP